jgi:hypothetical protein
VRFTRISHDRCDGRTELASGSPRAAFGQRDIGGGCPPGAAHSGGDLTSLIGLNLLGFDPESMPPLVDAR